MTPILYYNARLLDPGTGRDQPGALVTADGVIQSVTETAPSGDFDTKIDCGGRILCPGFIDMRAHAVQVDAALAGGITTVILQADQKTLIDNDAAVERIRARARALGTINVYPMGAATKGMHGDQMVEVGLMQSSGAIAFGDTRKSIVSNRVMRRLLDYTQQFDALVCDVPQDADLAGDGLVHEGEIATRLGLPPIPVAAELIALERGIRLVELTGGRLHFPLISSAQGVDIVRAAKARGLAVSAGISPPYLHLNDNALEGYRTFAKLSPPLRSEEDRLALIEGLADGTIDVIVSDHDPQSSDGKRQPFDQAATGLLGFESLLALCINLVQAGHISLERVIDALTAQPAKLLGLKSGTLTEGSPADLVVFDPNKPWRLDRMDLRTTQDNVAFDLLPVQGKVWKTIVDGHIVFEEAQYA